MLERSPARLSPRIVEAHGAARARAARARGVLRRSRRRASSSPLDWSLIGPFARRVLRATARDPLRRRRSATARSPPRGQPARLAGGGQRARLKPDPDRHPLPPRAAHRRGARRLRRRAGAKALLLEPGGRDRRRRLPRLAPSVRPRRRSGGVCGRGPLGLGEVARRHALGGRHERGVAQVALGVERRLAAGPGGGDRLAIGVIDEVAGGEHAGAVRARRAALGDDVAVLVEVDLARDELGLRLVADGDEGAGDLQRAAPRRSRCCAARRVSERARSRRR